MVTGTTAPLGGMTPSRCIAVTVAQSVWSGSGPEVTWLQAAYTVGKYPTHMLSVSAEFSRHSGTASTATTRRHHRALRHPSTAIAVPIAVSPIQTHSSGGDESPDTPANPMYQCAATAPTTPTASADGSSRSRQRGERQPIAHSNTATLNACTAGGSQPCISDTRPMDDALFPGTPARTAATIPAVSAHPTITSNARARPR